MHNSPQQSRSAWTEQEDDQLREAVARYGDRAWATVAVEVPGRSSKSCSDRWRNFLSPTIEHPRKSPFSEWEVAVVVQAQHRYGNNWKAISMLLPGRTNRAVKNLFVGNLKWGARLPEIQNTYLELRVPLEDLLDVTPDGPGAPTKERPGFVLAPGGFVRAPPGGGPLPRLLGCGGGGSPAGLVAASTSSAGSAWASDATEQAVGGYGGTPAFGGAGGMLQFGVPGHAVRARRLREAVEGDSPSGGELATPKGGKRARTGGSPLAAASGLTHRTSDSGATTTTPAGVHLAFEPSLLTPPLAGLPGLPGPPHHGLLPGGGTIVALGGGHYLATAAAHCLGPLGGGGGGGYDLPPMPPHALMPPPLPPALAPRAGAPAHALPLGAAAGAALAGLPLEGQESLGLLGYVECLLDDSDDALGDPALARALLDDPSGSPPLGRSSGGGCGGPARPWMSSGGGGTFGLGLGGGGGGVKVEEGADARPALIHCGGGADAPAGVMVPVAVAAPRSPGGWAPAGTGFAADGACLDTSRRVSTGCMLGGGGAEAAAAAPAQSAPAGVGVPLGTSSLLASLREDNFSLLARMQALEASLMAAPGGGGGARAGEAGWA